MVFGTARIRIASSSESSVMVPSETALGLLRGDRATGLVATGTAAPVTMGKRTMREWVGIPAETSLEATRASWTGLAREALVHVLGTHQRSGHPS